jgi:hypothetical protein
MAEQAAGRLRLVSLLYTSNKVMGVHRSLHYRHYHRY